ncbi:MAG: hypothetical protein DSY57_00740 [Desulfobulbus sp.]|nr:MAG: hypothetical protein DSY57_00740 [Desulfobulbus sp.]
MAWKKLEESEYEAYFDKLSKAFTNEKVEIEVLAVSIGAQKQTRWIPLIGISYDPREKTIFIISEAIDHHIKRPQDVQIHETDAGIDTIQITGSDGYEHLLKLKNPVAL